MDSGHFGYTPTVLGDAIVTALSALQYDGNTGLGVVRTIGKLRKLGPEAIKSAMRAGCPALLLLYEGFTTDGAGAMSGQTETDTLAFRLLCISADETTVARRKDGGDRDSDTATRAGVEDLQDWGRYLALRALHDAGARVVKTVKGSQVHHIGADHFVADVEFTCERELDIWDDDVATSLASLGICHDPTNGYGAAAVWFDGVDEADPVSDEPRTIDGGVASL